MFTNEKNLSLENIAKGEVIEEFDIAFTEVVRDILDHNTVIPRKRDALELYDRLQSLKLVESDPLFD